MKSPIIMLEGIKFGYEPETPVLDGVDFALRPGERIALLGPNAAGKTTLLHIIVGLLKPQSGRVIVFGGERKTEKDFFEVRAGIGLLFQDSDDQLFCPTVAEDVAFGPLNLGMNRKEAADVVSETLETLGLNGYEERLTWKLSGGEKRLVALATVLAMRPQALLLDEPTGGLDDSGRERITDVLLSLDQAMVLVSHDGGFLNHTADKAVRLDEGVLSAELWPAEVEIRE